MRVDKVQTSRNLRVLMAARHADVASLASALNVSRTTVYNYLEAKRTPDPERSELICRLLGVQMTDLIAYRPEA